MKMISTDKAPAAIGPYSQAVHMGRWVYTSGQIALNPETKTMVQDTFSEEVNQVLSNLKEVLAAGGCSVRDIIKTTVFLTDLGVFAEFNALYESFLEGHKPARSTIQVAALPLGARVEIEALAIVP